MAHVIPTLRTTHPAYAPPAMRRNSDSPADFRAVLKSHSVSPLPAASNPTQTLSSSFLRTETPPSLRSGVAPAGGESATPVSNAPAASSAPSGPVNVLSATPSQPKSLQTAVPTQAAAPAAGPSFFPGTNIPTQNPFGPAPYFANPTQNIFDTTGGSTKTVQQSLAPYYYPTQQTAQTVAQLFGGTVFVQSPDGASPFTLNQPSYMVRLANGAEINPGIISHFYDTRSDTPAQLQQLVQDVLNGGTMATLQPNNGGYATGQQVHATT
jgi:hypothetical protein